MTGVFQRVPPRRYQAILSLFILLLVGAGQCCLMWASGSGSPNVGQNVGHNTAHAHVGAVDEAMNGAARAAHASHSSQISIVALDSGHAMDACCADVPMLVSTSVSAKVSGDLVVLAMASATVAMPTHPEPHRLLRAPPRLPERNEFRARLQIYRI